MWTIVLLMALGVSVEPTRLGLTVLMLNRPRPLLQLFVFLCGAFAMGLSLGLTLLFVLRVSPIGKADVSGPSIQVALGVLALLVAAVLAATASVHRPPAAPRTGVAGKLATRVRGFLQNNSLWVAGVSGLGIALPSADFLAVIALIHASGATQPVQSMALLFFNAVAFSMVGLPLLSYAAMPRRTYEMVSALHTWVRSRRRIDVAVIVAVLGLIMLALGVIGILRA
ncbi:GAP family protein [Mycobacterium sp. CBMA271]|uniref:GAP family protein n=1 Tax=unclassified Mycobacteroides TaxID=2618759 RepID=UPI0012DD9220|nr:MULTISPECIES: GAP family protein [unclassified Mycobacteroides]MUM19944.1 hypothetical protein [Mycobacteroides sp. CBMA 326]MUM20115.1 GAP family protein [Mycobacteroides sp. CBMA 271]